MFLLVQLPTITNEPIYDNTIGKRNLELASDNTIGYDICTAVLSLASVANSRLL